MTSTVVDGWGGSLEGSKDIMIPTKACLFHVDYGVMSNCVMMLVTCIDSIVQAGGKRHVI
jgi:hypothetical protein